MIVHQKIANLLSFYEDMGVNYVVENLKDIENIIDFYSRFSLQESNENEVVDDENFDNYKDNINNKLSSNSAENNFGDKSSIINIIDNQVIISTINQIKVELANINSMEELNNYILNFNFCGIKKTAIHTILGKGKFNSEILLLSGVPANDEDESGVAFSGVEGTLLKNMLKTINNDVSNIFMSYSVFWRPPGNRELSYEELAVCFPIIEKMILILKPKYLILADEISRKLFFPNSRLSAMLLKWHEVEVKINETVHSCLTRVIFSPKYLLNNPLKKKDMWLDLIDINKKIVN